jgi:hypothetical protein
MSQPPEKELKSTEIQVERKIFTLALRENAKGQFLRITEEVSGRRNVIVIPATGLADFDRIVSEMATQATVLPS